VNEKDITDFAQNLLKQFSSGEISHEQLGEKLTSGDIKSSSQSGVVASNGSSSGTNSVSSGSAHSKGLNSQDIGGPSVEKLLKVWKFVY